MCRAAMLTLFGLAAMATVFAQRPAGDGNQPIQIPNLVSSSQPGNPNPHTTSSSTTMDQAATPGNTQAAPAATQESSAPTSMPTIGRVDAGTELHATLDTPLSTRTSKPGDRFTASLTDLVRANDGAVVIPSGSHIEGEVAEAEESKAMAALREKGALSLRFRNLVLPNGQTLPFTATLVSVHDTRGKNSKRANAEGQMQSGSRAQDAGISAGTGLVFGGPLKGLAIGALAGGGYVLSTKGKDVQLPAQTGMVIRLDQPVSWNVAVAPQ